MYDRTVILSYLNVLMFLVFFIKQRKFCLFYHILQLFHILQRYFSGQNFEKKKEGMTEEENGGRKKKRGKEHEEGE